MGVGAGVAATGGAVGSAFWPQAANKANDATGMIWMKRRRDAVDKLLMKNTPLGFANKLLTIHNGPSACMVYRVAVPIRNINKSLSSLLALMDPMDPMDPMDLFDLMEIT